MSMHVSCGVKAGGSLAGAGGADRWISGVSIQPTSQQYSAAQLGAADHLTMSLQIDARYKPVTIRNTDKRLDSGIAYIAYRIFKSVNRLKCAYAQDRLHFPSVSLPTLIQSRYHEEESPHTYCDSAPHNWRVKAILFQKRPSDWRSRKSRKRSDHKGVSYSGTNLVAIFGRGHYRG